MDKAPMSKHFWFFSQLARLSQFAPQKGHFWAFVSWKPLIFLGSISKTACSADLPS